MTSAQHRVITVATKAEFKDKGFYDWVWGRAAKVPISRRKWLDAISDSLLRDGIDIVDAVKRPFAVPDIDEVFGDDPDMRWISFYLKHDGTRKKPLHRVRTFNRLQLIHLYLEIAHPENVFIFPGSSGAMLHSAAANERK